MASTNDSSENSSEQVEDGKSEAEGSGGRQSTDAAQTLFKIVKISQDNKVKDPDFHEDLEEFVDRMQEAVKTKDSLRNRANLIGEVADEVIQRLNETCAEEKEDANVMAAVLHRKKALKRQTFETVTPTDSYRGPQTNRRLTGQYKSLLALILLLGTSAMVVGTSRYLFFYSSSEKSQVVPVVKAPMAVVEEKVQLETIDRKTYEETMSRIALVLIAIVASNVGSIIVGAEVNPQPLVGLVATVNAIFMGILLVVKFSN